MNKNINRNKNKRVLYVPDFILKDNYIKIIGFNGVNLFTYIYDIFKNQPKKLLKDNYNNNYYIIDNYEIMRVIKVSYGIAIRLKKKLNKTDLIKFHYNKDTDQTQVYLNRLE